MKKFLLPLILLVSLVSASHVWEFNTDGEVSIKPVVYMGNAIIASADGSVYAVNPTTGLKQWELPVNGIPNEVYTFDNGIVVSTTNGNIVRIGSNGKAQWTVTLNLEDDNVSYVYGSSTNGNTVFVSTNTGIFTITKTGNATRIYTFEDGTVTAPAAGSGFVVFGREDELMRITETGALQWSTKLEQGSFWLSRPVIDGGILYVGALDNKMHAYSLSNGLPAWEARARSWVVGTPLVDGGYVYFGSNDGSIYAVNSGTGKTEWQAETQLAVQTQPEAGYMGGQEVIFVGGTDKNIYAISKDSGDILWKGSAEGAVGSPLYYQNLVISGSQTGQVNAHTTERACSITNPIEGQLVGKKELVVNGKYVSAAGGATIMMSINGVDWVETNTTDDGWLYYLDPSTGLATGLNLISCMVVDAGGQESGPDFTTVAINHDPTMALSNIVVRKPGSVIEGEEFMVYVNDGDDGSPLERFEWSLDGQEGVSNNNITLRIGEPGTYELSVKKIGFKDKKESVEVYASGVNPIFLVIGVILIVVILWFVWSKFISQRFKKKKR